MASIVGFIITTISAGGYLGIVGLMAIESACIPLPSEIIMPFAGYLVSTGRFNLPMVATAGALVVTLAPPLPTRSAHVGDAAWSSAGGGLDTARS
jgi:membrane protein DedA with SNARE-associated domain